MAPRKFDRYMVAIGMGTHPKFARLTDSEFRAHVVGVLAIAAMAPVRGCLLVGDLAAEAVDIAKVAGVPERVAASAIRKLEAVGVLRRDEEHACLRVHDWDDVNPPPKSDPGNAERQRRYRQRNAQSNASRNAEVTLEVTPPEVEVEAEVEERGPKGGLSSSDASGADAKVTEDDKMLCALLRDLAAERNPKFKVKSRSRWVNDMRLLRERDGNSAGDIDRAIRWVFRDDFWGGVIQSPGNLREHFPAIWDRMNQSGKVVQMPRRESASDLLRAINSEEAS